MKKMVLFFVILLSPCLIVKAEECSKETIMELKEKARNVEFDIEYKKSEEIDQTDKYFEISSPNLSEDLFVTFQGEPHLSYMITSGTNVLLKGGVYNVEFVSIRCEESVYSYSLMIPYFNETNSDVWFDGTYESETKDLQSHTTVKRRNFLLIAIGSFALILIIVISVIMVKRRRKIK